jgi:L-iditol 2-dehydrogenase
VLECAGVPDTFKQSLRIARRGGTVVVFGVMPQGQEVAVTPFDLLVNELRVEGAYLNPLTHGRAAAMVASGVLDLDSLISQTIGLGQMPAVLMAAPGFGEIKTIVVPSQL